MLTDRLTDDMKASMKARDAERTSTLRMTLAEIKNARIQKGGDLTDDDVIQVLKRALKQREESATQYRENNRPELAAKEEAEAAILSVYLPAMLSGDALDAAVREAIASTGATSMKDMGQVMKAVMAAHGSSADGKSVQAKVRELLG